MFLSQIEKHLRALRSASSVLHVAPANTQDTHCEALSVPSEPSLCLGVSVMPLTRAECSPGRYITKVLGPYSSWYDDVCKELSMDDTKKVAAPIPLSLYSKVSAYLAEHHGEEGYPQTIKEFLTLSLEHLLRDLAQEERSLKRAKKLSA